MKLTMRRVDDAYRFESVTPTGHRIYSDASEEIGGHNSGPRPMEMVLAAVASCSSIDVVFLLNKQRQIIDDLQVDVSAERAENPPRVFTSIHLHYRLKGELDEKKVERACRLSMEKMCSVSLMLKGKVDITWSYALEN